MDIYTKISFVVYQNSNLTGCPAFFTAKFSNPIFTFLEIIEEPKELLFMWAVSVAICHIRSPNLRS